MTLELISKIKTPFKTLPGLRRISRGLGLEGLCPDIFDIASTQLKLPVPLIVTHFKNNDI